MLLDSLQSTDQYREAGRVHEVDAVEIDDDLVVPFFDLTEYLFSKFGRRVNINLTLDRNDSRAFLVPRLNCEIDFAPPVFQLARMQTRANKVF